MAATHGMYSRLYQYKRNNPTATKEEIFDACGVKRVDDRRRLVQAIYQAAHQNRKDGRESPHVKNGKPTSAAATKTIVALTQFNQSRDRLRLEGRISGSTKPVAVLTVNTRVFNGMVLNADPDVPFDEVQVSREGIKVKKSEGDPNAFTIPWSLVTALQELRGAIANNENSQ